VPRFEPFRGIRFTPHDLDPALVTAPPYDVISPQDRVDLIHAAPTNVVRIDLPVGGEDPYREAARVFETWRADGTLVTDATPSFTVYRIETTDEEGNLGQTTGVIGAMELSRPGEGDILPHEFTTPKAKSDRLELLRSTRSNLSAVWGLSPAPGLTQLLHCDDEPDVSFEADGVVHSVWIITDEDRIDSIRAAIASHPVVIADGHHRYETSLAYRDERRNADGNGDGNAKGKAMGKSSDADSVMTFVVELAEEELTVGPIHRLVSDLPAGINLLELLSPYFESEPFTVAEDATVRQLQDKGGMALVLRDSTWLLTPRPEVMAEVRDLDSARLDFALNALPAHTLRYQHGVDNIQRAVASGDAQAGVLLRPVTVAQIVEIARGGERMPPKSTFFAPKPRTGIVFRSIDE